MCEKKPLEQSKNIGYTGTGIFIGESIILTPVLQSEK